MSRGLIDLRRLVDRYDAVHRRVKHQQRGAEFADTVGRRVALQIVQQLSPDAELAQTEFDRGFARGGNLVGAAAEQVLDVTRGGRSTDRHHRAHRFQPASRGQHRGTPEAVTDQDLRRLVPRLQGRSGAQQVIDVGGKVGVGEIAVAVAEPGEIEAQHRDTARRQRAADARGRRDILAAGKAVGKQRVGAHLARSLRQFQQAGQLFARGIPKLEFYFVHARLRKRLSFWDWAE